jgi:putative FmdB family regulatory protein
MPTYEYKCRDCGGELEVVQSFADDPLTTCPRCTGSLRKVFSPVGIVLKGSGFYRTDSRSGNGKSAGTSSSTETKTESRSESRSESKPDAKQNGSGSSSSSSSDRSSDKKATAKK